MSNPFLSFTVVATFWLIIAASFSINLPVAFGSLSLGLFLIFWIISGNFQEKLSKIIRNPGAVITLVFLGWYALGMTYSSASLHDSFHYFMKYEKLLIIPLVVGIYPCEKYRRYAINAFLISLIGYLFISYLNWFGFFSLGVMRHGTYMALGAYFMLRNAKRKVGQYRVVWSALGALTIINVLFIADVRTGIVTLALLLVIFAYETWMFKGLVYMAGLGLITLFIYKNIHEPSNLRVVGIKNEISADVSLSSAGQRLEMYRNTFILIKQHPFFGGGTGSIEGEYTKLIDDDQSVYIRKVTNPHNQYLMTTQELGIFGLLILFTFFGVHWWQSYHLVNKEYGNILRALIISTATGSVFNSLLLDSGDGRMYCIIAGVLLSAFTPKSSCK